MQKYKKPLIGCGIAGILLVICVVFGMIYGATPAGKAASTERSITKTAQYILTQNAPTETLRPTKTIRPTNTLKPTKIPATRPALIEFTPTNTLQVFPSSTPTRLVIKPTFTPDAGSGVPGCGCTGRDLDCPDFANRRAAQKCFDYCVSKGFGDIYHLDQDKDGRVCEN